jgi:hypothetical protein
MKVHIVNYEQGMGINGILSKFAQKMYEELTRNDDVGRVYKDLQVTVSDKPDETADINHHINYLQYKPNKTKNTLMVTHIFDNYKRKALEECMKTADLGITMSKDMQSQLVKWGFDKKKLPIVLPAHDGLTRRHQVVAILTNVYPDGCKRQEMFTELAKTLDNNKWAFRIMGKDWSDILVPLVANGLQVDYFADFDYDVHKQILDSSDYCLYFGKDEGSMAILDAKNAGLKLITTNQGFHKEIGVDYPFDTQEELNAIFKKLSVNPVEDWTWEKYCKEHVKLWQKL